MGEQPVFGRNQHNMSDDNTQPIDLPPEDMEFIAENLAEIAEYFGQLEAIWDENADVDNIDIGIPQLSPESAEKLRQRVLSNIHRTDMAATTLRLGTEGVMQVLLALVKPVMSLGSKRKKEE